jgi:hypothetical protein
MFATPRIACRYRPVLWEPIEATGERIVALLSIEPADGSSDELAATTRVILGRDRLRAMLGKTRGESAYRTLVESAAFMSGRQIRGEPIEQLRTLFHGFVLGPIHHARGYSVDQLLDAMVRTVSAFGAIEDELSTGDEAVPAATRRTADFLRQVRRTFAAGDQERQRRFHVRLQHDQNAPEVWIDYAAGPAVVQVATVPGSANQAPPAEAELKSKILDLEVLRGVFHGNRIDPTLLLNTRSLEEPVDEDGLRIAKAAHAHIRTYAEWARLPVVEVTSAAAAVKVLETME